MSASTSESTQPATTPQMTFPGQAAAPPGPCDLMPMYLMHHAFRRDLRLFGAAATATPLEDRAAWKALQARWRRFARVLHLHHEGEDLHLWPLLLDRVDAAGNADGRATLEAMEAEHGEIDPLLTGCTHGFARLAATPDSDARAALVVRLAATRERLGHHLGHEETDAMALVQRHLTQEEWHDLDAEFAREYRPGDVVFALPWILHDLPADTWPRVRAFLGGPMVALWRVALRAPFERRERRAFRWATQAPDRRDRRDRWGRLLVGTLGVVVATDLVGGVLDIAAGRSSFGSAWGPGATLCAPLPMVAFQVVAVVLALRARPVVARVASGLLALACLVSVVSGFFDHQLARSDLSAGEVAFQVWLLTVTAALGGVALARSARKPLRNR
jgi:hypothetical protein